MKRDYRTWWRKKWRAEGGKFFCEYGWFLQAVALATISLRPEDQDILDCHMEQAWADKQGFGFNITADAPGPRGRRE